MPAGTYRTEKVREAFQQLQSEAKTADQLVADLTGQLDKLQREMGVLEQREHLLTLDLDASTNPASTTKTRRVPEIAVELALVRGGIEEVARFIRQRRFLHDQALERQRTAHQAIDDFGNRRFSGQPDEQACAVASRRRSLSV